MTLHILLFNANALLQKVFGNVSHSTVLQAQVLPAAGIHTTNGLGQSLNCSTAPSGGLELEQGSVTFLWENLMCLYCQLSNLYYGLYFKYNFILFPCLHFPMLEQNLQVELVSVGF